MSDDETTSEIMNHQGSEAKLLEVKELLRCTTATRKQLTLYGVDHPNTQGLLQALAERIGEFVKVFGNATLVFTADDVIVNDHCYSVTEGHEIFERLRARGVMAVTFVGAPSPEQVKEFLMFLSTRPRDIRLEGRPSDYLRKHGVSRIAVTEAVYAGDEEEDGEASECQVADPACIDRVIGATINWLMKNDEEEQELPPTQLMQILADPDSAAKLIREAVTKKHAANRDAVPGEIADGVVHDLKDLAATDPESWDSVTPQIRKAISKLPKDMRPASGGFISDCDDVDVDGSYSSAKLDVSEVEAMMFSLIDSGDDGLSKLPDTAQPPDLESLFRARASGLISSWSQELQASSLTRSSGSTLAALMAWEDGASEHGRIARALAMSIPKALEAHDMESALEFAGMLAAEAIGQDEMTWRSINARVALQSLGIGVLSELVEIALKTGNYRHREIASSLVGTLPDLALKMLHLLGKYKSESFDDSLKCGIVKSGQAACTTLGRLLCQGSPACRRSALEILIDTGNTSAVREITTAMRKADDAFLIEALGQIVSVKLPLVTEFCLEQLSHRSPEVRLAALSALGKLDDTSILPRVAQIAMRRAFRRHALNEKIAAIAVLGDIGGEEELAIVERMAGRRPLFGRTRYRSVQESSRKAAEQIKTRQSHAKSEVARSAA